MGGGGGAESTTPRTALYYEKFLIGVKLSKDIIEQYTILIHQEVTL